MATDKEIKLVEQLLDKTRRQMLSWEPTARGEEFFSTLGGDLSFAVGPWAAGSYALIMRDQHGRKLLGIDSDDVTQVSELYRMAQRQGLKVDESLDQVLEQLTKLDRR